MLADRIRSSLGPLEKWLDVPHVHVTVARHVAILHGEVGTEADATAIERAVPVNFALVGDAIVLRTAAGSKLEAALANAVVAFEVDSIDPLYHTGWSVLVQRVASEVVDPSERERLRAARLRPWADHDRDRFVRICTDMVSGRRLVQPPPPKPMA